MLQDDVRGERGVFRREYPPRVPQETVLHACQIQVRQSALISRNSSVGISACLYHCRCLFIDLSLPVSPLRWPSGQGVRLKSGRSRVRIPLAPGFIRDLVIPVTSKLALKWLPCQAPGVIGSVMGLVDPVSVYCDWVRWKV